MQTVICIVPFHLNIMRCFFLFLLGRRFEICRELGGSVPPRSVLLLHSSHKKELPQRSSPVGHLLLFSFSLNISLSATEIGPSMPLNLSTVS